MRQTRKTILGVVLVLIGGMGYLLFRPTRLLIYQLASRAGMEPLLRQWREHTMQWDMPEWVVYCLPDGLWSAGYVLIVSGLFRPHPLKWLVAGIIPLVGALSELAQWMGMLPGRFDVVDIVCYLLPYALYLALSGQEDRKESINNKPI